jgi:hypothetical protein
MKMCDSRMTWKRTVVQLSKMNIFAGDNDRTRMGYTGYLGVSENPIDPPIYRKFNRENMMSGWHGSSP